MLGTVSRDRVMAILKALISGDASAVMRCVAELADLSPDYAGVLADLLALLHQLALAQKVPEAVDEHLLNREELLQLATQVSTEDIQLFYQIGLIGRRDLPLAPDPRGGLEMALLRMLAFRPTLEGRAAAPAPVAAVAAKAVATSLMASQVAAPRGEYTVQASTPAQQAPPQSRAPEQAVASPGATPPAPGGALKLDGNWSELVEAMNLRGMVKQLALNCTLQEKSATDVKLLLSRENEQLLNPAMHKKLQEALCSSLQQTLVFIRTR